MSYSFGKKLKLTILGESHQKSVGITIEGLPAGHLYPKDLVLKNIQKRSGGQKGTTPRKETDEPIIHCGLKDNRYTGANMLVTFDNQNTNAKDYPLMFRPSHSDYPAYVKYQGYNDYSGGGQFSARLTLPLVFAGSLAQDLLEEVGIFVETKINQIGKMKIDELNDEVYAYLDSLNGDSVGAKLHTEIKGMPVGIGEPFFDSIESQISHLCFSIPGCKGVIFGDGIEMVELLGSQANDLYDEDLKTTTNHNGGVLGGLSNGMPIVFDTLFKPTSSIALTQNTYNPLTKKVEALQIKGRHDPCIGIRAVPILTAVSCIAILDLLLYHYGTIENMKGCLHGSLPARNQ